jgi:hypothetical protein
LSHSFLLYISTESEAVDRLGGVGEFASFLLNKLLYYLQAGKLTSRSSVPETRDILSTEYERKISLRVEDKKF